MAGVHPRQRPGIMQLHSRSSTTVECNVWSHHASTAQGDPHRFRERHHPGIAIAKYLWQLKNFLSAAVVQNEILLQRSLWLHGYRANFLDDESNVDDVSRLFFSISPAEMGSKTWGKMKRKNNFQYKSSQLY
ncbi:hypothetical protein TKK_0016561 [Trichogramma kaykai]